MIPEIGLMVGLYIVARMLELLTVPRASTTTRVLLGVVAVLVIVVTILVVADLMQRGSNLNLPSLR
jgi:hypothetical protein